MRYSVAGRWMEIMNSVMAARHRSDAVIPEFRDRERDGFVVRFRLHLDRVRCAFRVGEGGAAGPDAHERDYAYIRFLFSHMTEQLFWHAVMPP
jgi:hypothetical protein